MKKSGTKIAVVALSVIILFGAVFLTGGTQRFIDGNIQTFSLTNDFSQINCDMWNALAVTKEGGLKVTVDSSRETGFNPFFDTSLLSITDGQSNIEQLHAQLWITCQGSFMDESDAVTVGGSVSTMICGDPVSGTTKCLVGDDRLFSGDLRNANEFVNINLGATPLPDDTPTRVAEFTFSAQELELEYTSDNGRIFFESTMFPNFEFTFNHPTKGVFKAHYNAGQQNDGVVAQYGDLQSTSTANSSETDFDGDGFNDLVDLCPTQPETVNGFQDTDGCPDTVDNSGTTDTDGDGIVDNDDACDFAQEDGLGLFPNDGCPDTVQQCTDSDFDGVCDTLDVCPFVQGFAEFDGCPVDTGLELQPTDGDGDGVFDANDLCPTQGGFVDSNGCPFDQSIPDIDNDGVPDSEDACPLNGGLVDASGCPIECDFGFTYSFSQKICVAFESTGNDSDNDGIPDSQDLCATEPEDFNGIADTDGCPEGSGVEEPIFGNPVDVIQDVIQGNPVDEEGARTITIILLLLGGLLAVALVGRFIKKKR